MTGLESAVPGQPIVKDVQTLKANLKEQEKRARSENEAQELLPGSDAQLIDDEEQRKRQKVSNPVETGHESEVVILDGPLTPTKEETKPAPAPSKPSKINESPVVRKKDAEVATCNSCSPAKITDTTESSHAPKPVVDAPASAECKVSNGNPEATLNSVSPKKPAASDSQSLATNDKHTEEVTEGAVAVPEVKGSSTAAEPAVTTEKAISS